MSTDSALPMKPQEPKEVPAAEPTLEEQLQEYRDKYLRALAEVENTRKRLSREKLESQSFAVQNVIVDFLQPIDHFEQALGHAEKAPKEIADWARGFQMILQQLQQILADHGASHFNSVGQLFDPHLHEAVETEERLDVPEGTVLFEFQKGYRLGSRTIRAAKVRVATRQRPENVAPEAPTPQES